MGWAAFYIEALKKGEFVQFRPRGHSMTGKVNDGQLVTVEPLKEPADVGDVVLCKVKGREFLHLVKATRGMGQWRQYQIGNNKGFINGWTNQVFGKVTKVED
jgi:SOS-response transcriptional repressor LexA